MKRNILLHPDPRLKKMAGAVVDLSDKLQSLADDMVETMYAAPGIGLAAPQLGVLERLIVLDCTPDDIVERRALVMFNPQVIARSEETSRYAEGCLSIPDHYAEVTRPAEVTVTWLDRGGTPQQQDFFGLWSTCVQHEIDHLDGKLFIDYLGLMKRQMITRKMQKLKREKARV
ncbi:MAG: peptide deformylase [Paracoccaceae bacterium]|jgi:peptide deformylase|nr:peptide deformylase [Paracoccaceae bacterium]